ncbi:hypothetical protein [Scandinavium tedordense]
MKELLQVNPLGYQPGGTPLLHNINLTLNEGQFTLITGPSGRGKCRELR